jgi:hypothetical protein
MSHPTAGRPPHPHGDSWINEMEEVPGEMYPVAILTDKLLVEILSHLPARSVCRFKCVSLS